MDDFVTYICPKTAHIKVKLKNGGVMPESLTGLFTTEREAKLAINRYVETMQPKKILKIKEDKLEKL